MPFYKAIILIAGPQKGTRFRPLSLDVPKPLFPVAGVPVIQHHIEAISKVQDRVKEVLILGSYPKEELDKFADEMSKEYNIPVRYLQEHTTLGTAGGLFHFRDRILSGSPDGFFVLNGDVCAEFPMDMMLQFYEERINEAIASVMATEATKQQSLNYGCLVEDKDNQSLLHFVEKPATYVSSIINCGVYLFSKEIFPMLQEAYNKKQSAFEPNLLSNLDESLWIEKDILPHLTGTGKCRVFQTKNWWSQMKTASAAIYANRHYLNLYRTSAPKRLTSSEKSNVIGDVFIHPTASVDPTAVLGPNVSIGPNVVIGAGTRVRESIILANSVIGEHSLILYTVMGMNTKVGNWTRVEGTPNDPNPNKPFAKMENQPLFNIDGKMNPSITILGCNVEVPSEIVVLNAIVLPHKQINHSFKNEIVL